MELNKEIKNNRVLVVSVDDSRYTDVPKEYNLEDALSLSENLGMDLIKISETEMYAVCRIMDYTKFLYQQKKKNKNSTKVINKEIKFSLNISENDIETKLNNIKKMLNKGNRVLIKVELRGREAQNCREKALNLINSLIEKLKDNTKNTSDIKVDTYSISVYID